MRCRGCSRRTAACGRAWSWVCCGACGTSRCGWGRTGCRCPRLAGELLGIIAASVLFTWVFNNTRGSLLLVMLFHASLAVTGLFLAESHVHPAIDVVLAWLIILAIWMIRRRTRLPIR